MKPCTLPKYLIDAGASCGADDCELHGETDAPPAPVVPDLPGLDDDDDELPNTGI